MNVAKPEREGPLVLIVERDRFLRRFLESFLKAAPCELEFAADAVTALKKVGMRLPDLLITEVCLPRIDGFSLCKRLRAQAASAKPPVLMFSPLNFRKQALEAGAADFLLKPFDRAAFAKFVSPYLKVIPEAKS